MLKIRVRQGLHIRIEDLDESVLDALRREFEYKNPDYEKKKRLGFSVWSTPRTIASYDEESGEIRLPRGATKKLKTILDRLGVEHRWLDRRHALDPVDFELGGSASPCPLRLDQLELVETMLHRENCLIRAAAGSGKCLAPDTPVILFDGRTVPAGQVLKGDQLLGPDGFPREVLSTTRGTGRLYRIVPVKGAPWICNDVHVLTLVHTETGKLVDVALNDWARWNPTQKKDFKLFRSDAVRFAYRDEPTIDPYFLGVWFGDGRKDLKQGICITKPDIEIETCCHDVAVAWGLRVSVDVYQDKCPSYRIVGEGRKNPLLSEMKRVVGDANRIPDDYKFGRLGVRRAVLAGFLDTDGHLSNGVFDFVQKRKGLAEDVAFIARSLGIAVSMREKRVNGETYWRLGLSGDFMQLPMRIPRKIASVRRQKKNVLRTGFRVESVGVGEYAGFTLDGDGRFLLGDFTVTHNTEACIEFMRRLRQPTLVVVWTTGLVRQWVERLCLRYGWRPDDVGVIGSGKKRRGLVTIGMQQSLWRAPERVFDSFGAVICDEVQRFSARTFRETIARCPARYRIGVSADERRKDRMEFLIHDHFGEVAAVVTKEELIKRGDLFSVRIKVVPTGARFEKYENATDEMKGRLYREALESLVANQERTMLASQIAALEMKSGHYALVFSERVEHCREIAKRVALAHGAPCGLFLGGVENRDQYDETVERLKSGAIRGAVGTSCIYQGVDIPRLDRGVVATPTATNRQLLEQQVGRLRRLHPEKSDAVLWYLWDEHLFPGHVELLRRWYGKDLVELVERSSLTI